MILATLELNRAGATNHLPADIMATQRAVDDILQASLQADRVLETHVFSDQQERPMRTLALQRYASEKRITWKHLALLPKLSEENDYMHVAPWTTYRHVSRMRSGTGHLLFPTFNVVDSVQSTEALTHVALDVQRSAPFDVWVVNSHSSRIAFTQGLQALVNGRDLKGVAGTPRVAVVPQPVDTESFHPRDRRSCRETLGLPVERSIVLVAGQASSGRRVDVDPVIAAFADLVHGHPEAFLLIAGGGDPHYASEMAATIRGLGLQDTAKVIPDPPEHQRPLLCAAVDVFVALDDNILPSATLTPLQAMASGVPSVVTDWNGNREIVQDGVSGLLVPTYWNSIAGAMMSWLCVGESGTQFLADRTVVDVRVLREGIRSLLSDRHLRGSIGEAARAAVQKRHSPPAVAAQARDLWDSQQSALTAHGRENCQRTVDYSHVFRHYATSELNLDLQLEVTPRGRALYGDDLRPGDNRRVPPLVRDQVTGILEKTVRGRTPIASCVSGESQFSFEAVVWLLKKGYLSLSPN